jgi:hypothetical protein
MKSILLELRDAAKSCSSPTLRQALKDLADEMSGYLSQMTSTPCGPTMQQVNGCFARADTALKLFNTPSPPPKTAVPMERMAA